ncbi:hypothetical protein [Flavobacterium sp.]|jgi:hypothetical protein|uniref:hypothetical protein n=1 Tax=Flavobacterium sp. TaxID=239 RepID=UPI0037BFCC95
MAENDRKQASTKTKKAGVNQASTMTKEARLKALGSMTTSGTGNASMVMEPFQKNMLGQEVGLTMILESLNERVEKINAGDLSMVESMLFSQASALQTMFASLARRGSAQEYLKQYQTYMGLALKAQAQSRATLEALIELKQPRQQPTFVKQANIAAGHQQVNNTYATTQSHTGIGSHAANSQTEPNKLLEARHGERLDFGAQGQAGRADQDLEAVGAVNRPCQP